MSAESSSVDGSAEYGAITITGARSRVVGLDRGKLGGGDSSGLITSGEGTPRLGVIATVSFSAGSEGSVTATCRVSVDNTTISVPFSATAQVDGTASLTLIASSSVGAGSHDASVECSTSGGTGTLIGASLTASLTS